MRMARWPHWPRALRGASALLPERAFSPSLSYLLVLTPSREVRWGFRRGCVQPENPAGEGACSLPCTLCVLLDDVF